MEMKKRGGKLAPASRADGFEHKDEDGANYTDKKSLKNVKQHLAREGVKLFVSRICERLLLIRSPEEMFRVNTEHISMHRMRPDRLKCGVDQHGHKCEVKNVMITRQPELWLILNTPPVLSCQAASLAILQHFASKMSMTTSAHTQSDYFLYHNDREVKLIIYTSRCGVVLRSIGFFP